MAKGSGEPLLQLFCCGGRRRRKKMPWWGGPRSSKRSKNAVLSCHKSGKDGGSTRTEFSDDYEDEVRLSQGWPWWLDFSLLEDNLEIDEVNASKLAKKLLEQTTEKGNDPALSSSHASGETSSELASASSSSARREAAIAAKEQQVAKHEKRVNERETQVIKREAEVRLRAQQVIRASRTVAKQHQKQQRQSQSQQQQQSSIRSVLDASVILQCADMIAHFEPCNQGLGLRVTTEIDIYEDEDDDFEVLHDDNDEALGLLRYRIPLSQSSIGKVRLELGPVHVFQGGFYVGLANPNNEWICHHMYLVGAEQDSTTTVLEYHQQSERQRCKFVDLTIQRVSAKSACSGEFSSLKLFLLERTSGSTSSTSSCES